MGSSHLERAEKAEQLRAVITSLIFREDGSTQPLHANRLRAVASSFKLDSDLTIYLKFLTELGEFFKDKDGRLLPGPSTFIALGEHFLFFSPFPKTYFSKELSFIDSESIARITKNATSQFPTIDYSRWLGTDESLSDWGESVCKLHEKNILPLPIDTATIDNSLEFYLPSMAQGQRLSQFQRQSWIGASSVPSNLKNIATIARNGPKSKHFFVRLSGKFFYQSSIEILDSKKLRFYIDLSLNLPPTIAHYSAQDRWVTYKLYRQLPEFGELMVKAVGQSIHDQGSKSFQYRVPRIFRNEFESLLASLHIRITE